MENLYKPQKVKILKTENLSPTVKLFRIGFFSPFIPGQFFLLGRVGYGEAPFGALSSPYQNKYLEFAIRKAGNTTAFLHSLKAGEEIEIRGPYGNGFDLKFIEQKDIVMVTGGSGIPPIASLAEHIVKNREKFGNVYLLYGAKTEEELLLKDRMERWQRSEIKVLTLAGGIVTDLLKEMKVNEQDACAVMCGPGPMADAVEKIIRPLGISDRRIFVSLERKMQCGIGKCQHCTTGKKYVCLDGPVFYYDEIEKNYD
jgi:sulfhydrogenase subunit gamma (sulfur reductase)